MKYINASELADMMKNEKLVPKKDYLIIDVRDEDRVGGHIVGSVNEPSAGFLKSVDQLVSKIKDVPLVIFHCALSQMRGPKAARIYEETRDHMLKANKVQSKQEVAILRDGFVGFQDKFKDDPKLIEKWDKETWEPEEVIALSDDDTGSPGGISTATATATAAAPAPAPAPQPKSKST